MQIRAAEPAATAGDEDRYGRYPSLAGRVVLVSGGATGLGAEFVRQFVAQGSAVGFVDLDDEHGAGLAAELAGQAPVDPIFVPADVRNIPAYAAAIDTIADRLGPIAVLVNNAAHDERHEIPDVDVAYWDEKLAVNLRHHFFAVQAVVDGMHRLGGGSVVNIGSIAAHAQLVKLTAYITAKAGIEGLTRTLARELGRYRIRVNCLAPGWVMTDRQLAQVVTPEAVAMIAANQCLPDRLVPADVARLLMWLAADDSSGVTAQVLAVNAGWV